MDPNANLDELLALAEGFIEAADQCAEDEDPVIDEVDVMRMAELVLALDGWIGGGGFLPKRWDRDGQRAE